MAKGSSVFKIKKGWRGYVVIGRNAEGKTVKRWVSGKTKQEVEEKLKEIKPLDAKQVLHEKFDIKLSDWLQHFTKLRSRSVRPKTTQIHEGYVQHINAYLGGIKLRDLSRPEVQTFYNELHDKKLSHSVRNHIHHFLKASLNEARDQGIIQHLPIGQVPKSHTTPKSKAWSDKELKLFLKAAKESSYYQLFYALLDTGMRLGEALALRWTDYQGKQISITRTISIVRGQVTYNPPKTMRGYRTFQVSKGLANLLGEIDQDHELIFASESGEPLDVSNVRRCMNSLIAKSGVPRVRIHDLRHTFITRARERGVPVEVVAAMVGQDVKVTLDIYTKVSEDRKKEARIQLGDLLNDDEE